MAIDALNDRLLMHLQCPCRDFYTSHLYQAKPLHFHFPLSTSWAKLSILIVVLFNRYRSAFIPTPNVLACLY